MAELKLPEIGEGVYEAEFVSWMVKVGETVKSGQSLMEVLTDKATMEIPSPFAGTITELKVEAGQKIKVGDIVLNYSLAGEVPVQHPVATGVTTSEAVQEPPPASSNHRNDRSRSFMGVKAAPSVRQMARELGVSLENVEGSGPEGRAAIEDLSRKLRVMETVTEGPPPKKRIPIADFGKPGTTIKLQGVRGMIAEQMVRSKTIIPHYSYVDECNLTDMVKLRESLRERFREAGLRLTYLPFFIKAVTRALKEIPIVNATMNEEAKEITLHDQYNIGLAVSTQQGLMVPVIRDADQLEISQITREIERLSQAARQGKVKREELRGGTFTVTSVGSIGGLFSSPVINHPEVGILGIGKVVKRPIFDASDQVVAADMVHLSLSFDHRVVDGAVGAEFTNALIRHLESPASLLLPETLP